jgi:hypothetical protein
MLENLTLRQVRNSQFLLGKVRLHYLFQQLKTDCLCLREYASNTGPKAVYFRPK